MLSSQQRYSCRLGLPLSELKQLEDCSSEPLEPSCAQRLNKKSKSQGSNRAESRTPNSITLLRRRMLYSRPNDRWKETVRRGLGSSRMSLTKGNVRYSMLTLVP